MGRNKHTNFTTGTDMELYTLNWKGINVDDCKNLVDSGMLQSPKDSKVAVSCCRVYRAAGVTVKDDILSKLNDGEIVNPTERNFFSGALITADKETAKRYMQERDKKYNLTPSTGALWDNHLDDVKMAVELGMKPGKVKADDLAISDNDNDSDGDDDADGKGDDRKERPKKKSKKSKVNYDDEQIRKLENDLKAAKKMKSDLSKTVANLQQQLKDSQDMNEHLSNTNTTYRAELEQARKDRTLFESTEKRAAKYTKLGKKLQEKGAHTPQGKKLIDQFIQASLEDSNIKKTPV